MLSRLTGEPKFEEKVMRTMDIIWDKRNRASDLVGTVINVHSGEWSVKDASIGAGIDSYYEYLFKVSHFFTDKIRWRLFKLNEIIKLKTFRTKSLYLKYTL